MSAFEISAAFSGMFLLCSTSAVAIWTVLYAAVFWRKPSPRIADEQLPRTAVLMGLKGTDPYLHDGLRRLMTQDYPDYEVHIVIDSQDDPAWSLVESAIRDTGAIHVSMSEFRDVPEHGIVNCTNSKVVQALRGIDDSFEAIAMADGDVVADQNWLRELMSPLAADPQVGVTTGNRWFIPPNLNPGTLTRHLWNVATTSIMYHLKMPWGGCYGIRMNAVRDGNLVEKWAQVAALDMHTTGEMKSLGLKVHFVPSLMMLNRERSSLPFAANWIRRQLTWARLYNPGWWIVVAHTGLTAVAMAAALVLAPIEILTSSGTSAGWATSGLISYVSVMSILVALLEFSIRRRLRSAGQSVEKFDIRTLLAVAPVIVLTQFTQLVATLQATFLKRVAWRGSILEINGPHSIQVVDQQPQTAVASSTHRAA